ncbi:CoA ester lyase [Pseudomonas sp. NBRC 100443]|uniref:HpcH/HpaI aldolase/citrate lyase family protein n=1 Tax=Pseudomonas sp. NBRC 100443 TaxID=1113665 RepID=UPI0024A4CFA4|nr:CoA ester lyase [Pseudomonas sp. NBRC 100443]GLU39241.1 CoA ester lyase [Pseudomonas sp. NBRC 100443]
MSGVSCFWRSLLFVPAHVEKFIDRAHERGADACILDLEDSVPLAQKSMARQALPAAAAKLQARGLDVLARINSLQGGGLDDLEVISSPSLCAVVLPKVGSAEDVRVVAAVLERLELERGLAKGGIGLLAQIEDVAALPRLDEIASASPRLLGMSLGPEDFCVSASMEALPETLFGPSQQVAFACRRAGILPFGYPDSIALFTDLPRLRHSVLLARQLGMVGAFCIHPAQVAVLNELFSPASEDVEYAEGLLVELANARAEGRGAFAYRGRMVDPPVVARALELLERHRASLRRLAALDHH